jgi:co-chaperonin GroES (HSP10)
MPEIKLDPESNILKLGTLEMEAHADRILVLQDDFVSGFECVDCGGTGYLRCVECKGEGKYSSMAATGKGNAFSIEKKCSSCDGKGKQACRACGGKGGLLVIPDASERRPTTGTIVSVGNKVTDFTRGQGVLYPSFAGQVLELEDKDIHGRDVKVTIVILRDSEVLTKVKGHLELRRVKKNVAVSTAA